MKRQRAEKQVTRPPRFSIKAEGPRVGAARLSAADLAEIVRRTQQALKRVGQVLYGQESTGQGRKKKDIEELCELFVVGWKEGSAIADFELAPTPQQLSLFGYIGEESLKSFLEGMQHISSHTNRSLPAGFDVGVLQTCDALGKVLEHGIDSLIFEPEQGHSLPTVRFDVAFRDRVRMLLGQPVDQQHTEKIGRLEELNGHGGLTGRLWEADGTKWQCFFKQVHIEILPEAWLRRVRLTGQAVVEPKKEHVFHVDSVVVLEDESVEPQVASSGVPFWTTISLDELAAQQGVGEVTDLDELSNLWPVDDDPDEFMEYLLAERAVRRNVSEEGHP